MISLLESAKRDISADICGIRSVSSLNYIVVLAVITAKWNLIEKKLIAARNQLYDGAYAKSSRPRRRHHTFPNKERLDLGVLALVNGDVECLKIIANVLENPRARFMNYTYWDGLDTSELDMAEASSKSRRGGPGSRRTRFKWNAS